MSHVSVFFSDSQEAGDFQHLVGQDGTGDIADLLREGARFPGGPQAMPYPNTFTAHGTDRAATLMQAWYLDGPSTEADAALTAFANNYYGQYL